MREPPTLEEMSDTHHCWWRKMAEGLSDVLTELDSESQVSVLRQMLRDEKARRHALEGAEARAERRGYARALAEIAWLQQRTPESLSAELEAAIAADNARRQPSRQLPRGADNG